MQRFNSSELESSLHVAVIASTVTNSKLRRQKLTFKTSSYHTRFVPFNPENFGTTQIKAELSCRFWVAFEVCLEPLIPCRFEYNSYYLILDFEEN